MNNQILDHIGFFLIFGLSCLSLLLLSFPPLNVSVLGGLLFVWSGVALLHLVFLFRVYQRDNSCPSSHHHVTRLLGSFFRERQRRQYLSVSMSLRGALSVLAGCGLIYVAFQSPSWTMEQLAFAFLIGCIFWLIQSFAIHIKFAWILICLFGMGVVFHLSRELFFSPSLVVGEFNREALTGFLLILPLAGAYLYGLLNRYHYKEFPVIGLCTLAVMIYVVICDFGNMPLFLALWGLLGICWAQSWPRGYSRAQFDPCLKAH